MKDRATGPEKYSRGPVDRCRLTAPTVMKTWLGVGVASAATVVILGTAVVAAREGKSVVYVNSSGSPGSGQSNRPISLASSGPAVGAVSGPGASVSTGPSVTVSGVGTVLGTPDVLSVQIGVNVVRPTIASALSVADSEAASVVSTLEAHGVATADIQSALISLGPNYGNNGVDGYSAQNAVSANLRNLPAAGATLGAAVQAGGKDATLGGVYFNLEQNTRQVGQARSAAMGDALTQASDFARLAGRKLGPVQTVVENDSATPPPSNGSSTGSAGSAMAAAPVSMAVPIQAGQQQVQVMVTVTYALE